MFHDLTDGPLPYEAPWEQEPLATRLAAVRGGRPRVVWLCERPDTSTFRYRCLNPVATLATARPGIGAAWFERDDIPALAREVPDLDALVICCYRYDAEVARLAARAREAELALISRLRRHNLDTGTSTLSLTRSISRPTHRCIGIIGSPRSRTARPHS
jgi:hypothetical protein